MADLLTHVTEVIQDVSNPELAAELTKAFGQSEMALAQIQQSFLALTQSKPEHSQLCQFFHNWSMTNNSAAGLSGYCNRLTKRWRYQESQQDKLTRAPQYMAILGHLNRVSDEDLGVEGGIIHYDLYYHMATTICGDDQWMSRRFVSQAGSKFKKWKDHQLLKEKDLFVGMLTTLVHEIYTHGEVEFILPLFQQWLPGIRQLSKTEQARCLNWIEVHTCGTERNHFNETLATIDSLAELLNVRLADYDLVGIFSHYLSQKASVMSPLISLFQQDLASPESLPVDRSQTEGRQLETQVA